MSRRHRQFPLFLLVILGVLVVGSCSEDSEITGADQIGPSTVVVEPVSSARNPIDVSDSLDIYVAAADNRAVSRVEVWAWSETREEAQLVGTVVEPLPPEDIPDTIDVPAGSSVFYQNWKTRTIRNGTMVRIFSRAYDEDGNTARSDLIVVRILNKGGNLLPPNPVIIVTPERGKVDNFFAFDASATTDSVDTPDEISVRWDFDGDGIFEIDWDQGAVASTIQQYKYSTPGFFQATLEAHNSYLPEVSARVEKVVEVTQGDRPLEPPEIWNYTLVQPGTYFVGTPDSLAGDADERPIHQARFSSGFYIEKTEVSNRLYLGFLSAAMSGDDPRVRREENLLVYNINTREPVEEDSLPRPIVDFTYSDLFFDPDSGRIVCDVLKRELPVTGVTWHGARYYAEFYGMRLPTEHEWEVAAKGNNAAYLYPWGTTILPTQANYLDSGLRRLVPIRTYTAPDMIGPFEVYQLSGNAAEWVKDWYDTYSGGVLTNPEGPFTGSLKLLRGGSFFSSADGVRVTARMATRPDIASREIGFRTAFTDPGR